MTLDFKECTLQKFCCRAGDIKSSGGVQVIIGHLPKVQCILSGNEE